MIIEQGTPVRSSGTPRTRWTLAIVAAVAALAIAIGGVAGAFLVGGRSAGAGAGSAAAYVPGDALMYMELRLDLPGDQRAMLHQVLDRFKPIDPDMLLGTGLAAWLDDRLAPSSDPHVSYSVDIAPWFTGQLAMSVNDYPSSSDPTHRTFPDSVALLGSRDASAARAFADRMRGEAQKRGATFSSKQHQGVEVWSMAVEPSASGTGAGMMPGFAYAVTDDEVLLGTGSATVETALDVHAGSGTSLAQRAELQRLAERLPADRIGFISVDSAAMLKQLRAQADKLDSGMGSALDELMASASPFVVAAARFENDRLTFEAVTDAPAGAAAVHNSQRDLARWTPSDAILFSDAPDIGASLARVVHGIELGLGASGLPHEQLDQLRSALGGDLESFVSWVGDGAMVAGWDGEQPYGGLILVPTDAAAARQRIGQLDALARLAASQPGSTFSVSDQTIDGVKVTTIRDQQGSSIDSLMPSVALQYAITDEHVLIGFGDRFVERVLSLPQSRSLAASDRYRAAVASVGGTTNAGTSYIDLSALRAAIEKAIPPDARPIYEQMALPYLEPLDYLVSVTREDGGVVDTRAALVVR